MFKKYSTSYFEEVYNKKVDGFVYASEHLELNAASCYNILVMQKGIHPTYHTDTQVICACGTTFKTGSSLKEIHVDICSKCHPFYTGEQKFVDVEGRIDQFKKKMKLAESERKARIEKIKAKISKEKERQEAPKSLKDMLKNLK